MDRTPTTKSGKTSQSQPQISPSTETAHRIAPAQGSKVRRSVGEWEAAKTAPPPSEKQLKTSSKTYATKTEEARACLTKAKCGLAASRNLKSDIKTDVTQAVDRLYQLVKEVELELVTVRGGEPPAPKAQPTLPRTEDPESILLLRNMDRKIEENNRLLKENSIRMEGLKEAVEKQRDVVNRITYADAVSSGPTSRKLPERAALHSIVIASEKEEDSCEDVLGRVREAVDAKEGWVKIDRVRKAKDRKIIVGCGSKVEKEKIKERLSAAGRHLVVEDIKNKDPLLILRDLLAVHSDDEIIRALRNQNREVFDGLDEEDSRVAIKFRRKARNPHNNHIILSVSPRIWTRATAIGRLRIDLQRVTVEDQSPLVQCTRCLGYGHSRRFCKEPVDLCSHCGGPHLRVECPDRVTGGPAKCLNCVRAKREDVGHNAFSADCPVRARWDALARASVAYC